MAITALDGSVLLSQIAALGIAFAIVGVGMAVTGARRHRAVEGVMTFTVVCGGLGLATIALVIVNP